MQVTLAGDRSLDRGVSLAAFALVSEHVVACRVDAPAPGLGHCAVSCVRSAVNSLTEETAASRVDVGTDSLVARETG